MRIALLVLALGAFVLPSAAEETPRKPAADTIKLPAPAELSSLDVQPKDIRLVGDDDSRQLVVTAVTKAGQLQDLTGDVRYEIADPRVARITASGRVVPLGNGVTTITATYGARRVQVKVNIEAMDQALPISFANHIVPIFTKLGCNSGGCHGKSGGQNGFALSLLGFTPDFDFQTLVKENRGRRVMPAAPESSLLLLKATGTMAHAGGKRMETASDEYKLVRRWIAAGLPSGSASDPSVNKITVFPEQRVISRNNRQQFAVLAHYTDGSVQDVTARAQYESNDPDIAVVDGAALVRTLEMSGEAAIMARYQGQVATFRATVPLGTSIPEYKFAPQTVVDVAAAKKWRELGIVPSALAADEQFVRRVYVDITGTLPTPEQVKSFVADRDPQKRDKLIDRLVETPEYSYYFANRWADVLRVKRGNNQQQNRAFGTFAFHGWIQESIAADRPYNEFVREILSAIGDETKSPPTMWYRDLQKPEQFVDDACQLFLGVRMACAQCHHHPYEKWGQDDYWGMAAFFGMLGRKTVAMPGVAVQNQQNARQAIYNKGSGSVINKRTNQPAVMRPLDGAPVALSPGEDPRQRLVDWMVDPHNPFFARAVANRYWAHFFGKGIVDPVDDMRVTNPPSNPELLDALAANLIENKYSLKSLIRTICKSRTYQLSSNPNEFNQSDKQSYARYYPKRLQAEVLFDAVCKLTDSPSQFAGLPADKFAPSRAIMLPDESFSSYFLDVAGRPQRISACECERVSEASLAMSLHLLNSNDIQDRLARAGGRADKIAKDPRPDTEKIEELFLLAIARKPTAEQLSAALDHIEKNEKSKKQAYENILWALLNSKAFLFNQ
jgi:hypothetical protein